VHRELVASKDEALLLPVEERITIGDHMNNCIKLFAGLVNVDVVIEKEDKT